MQGVESGPVIVRLVDGPAAGLDYELPVPEARPGLVFQVDAYRDRITGEIRLGNVIGTDQERRSESLVLAYQLDEGQRAHFGEV